MDITVLFDTIHEFHYTIQLIFNLYFTLSKKKKIQFQSNKLFQTDTWTTIVTHIVQNWDVEANQNDSSGINLLHCDAPKVSNLNGSHSINWD